MMTRYAWLAIPLFACVADTGDTQIVLLNNTVPEPGCILAADSETFRGRGVINTAIPSAYLFTPRIQSFVAGGGDPSQRIAFVQGARVTLSMADATLQPALEASGQASFTQRFSVAVEPDGGMAVAAFDLVPATMLGDVTDRFTLDDVLPPDPATPPGSQATLLADVTLFGEMAGGTFETTPFTYPITLCRDAAGGLADCSGAATVGPCTALADDFMGTISNSCNINQDGVSVCCTHSSGGLTCPATKEQ
jgi:hypothetical protein